MNDTQAREDEEVPGLAGERTDMAWSRSGLSVLACFAAMARKFLPHLREVSATAWVVSAFVVGASGWIVGLFWARFATATTLAGRVVAHDHTLRIVAYGTALLGAVAITITFV